MHSVAMLQEMGIDLWQLRKPARVHASVDIQLPEDCQLLIIAPQQPQQIELMCKIIKSMGVEAKLAYWLAPHLLSFLPESTQVSWIWFCGIAPIQHQVHCLRQVQSRTLAELEKTSLFKKQLWHQIKKYKDMDQNAVQ